MHLGRADMRGGLGLRYLAELAVCSVEGGVLNLRLGQALGCVLLGWLRSGLL